MKKDYLHYKNNGNQWLWFWNSSVTGKTTTGELCPSYYYCTNSDGDGLFIVSDKGKRTQIVGTCQFSLAGLKNPKRVIRRYYGQ